MTCAVPSALFAAAAGVAATPFRSGRCSASNLVAKMKLRVSK